MGPSAGKKKENKIWETFVFYSIPHLVCTKSYENCSYQLLISTMHTQWNKRQPKKQKTKDSAEVNVLSLWCLLLSSWVDLTCLQLLGVLESLKGITSNQVASQCVLQSYTSGNTQLVNRTDAQTLSQFSAEFISNIDEDKGCNFAAYVPLEEDTPLQVEQ